ncbi:G2/mitotic-specific cyclin S13-7-like isoform X3 [Quercus robur]|uniref:G2/mitotic-specific cyclin S13-7-like isoform X3 n=1 Tax=Quercus robur TaxID=38942 RepID=UPI0021631C1D|nr:G2/mitotic-specific cyclin S13-7-like isoform X3 [Quercus robur]
MEARAVVPAQPRGAVKVKNEPAQGRNRRALGDIGNYGVQALDGKPNAQISRPMTRSFRAQLLAKEQGAVEINKKPVVPALDNRVAINRRRVTVKKVAEAQKRVDDKPNSDESKTATTTTTEGEKIESVSGRRSREGSSRKEVKTLTSILTARSMASCGVTVKPKPQIVNIDAADVNDELAVVEYIDDIYQFYKLEEGESRVRDYLDSQPEINARMRSILIDWLTEVHRKFELMPETLYLTINIVDRYLSRTFVSRRELQLVGISSMLIACKYEEIWAPQVNDFICLSDYAYTGEQILVMEKAILGKLEWYLTVPTPYVFLVRFIKASVSPDKEMENMVFFLAEIGLMHYPTIILYCPSMIAAAAVYAARCTLAKSPFWSETLKHHTGYSEEQLMNCAKLLVDCHMAAAAESKLSPDIGSVALFTPAKCFQAT